MDLQNRIGQKLQSLRERWNYLNPTHPLRKSPATIVTAFLGLVKSLLWIALVVTVGFSLWSLAKSPMAQMFAEWTMVPICKGLDTDELLAIESYLEEREVRNGLNEDTTAVLVMHDERARLRWELLAGGFPRTGRLWYGLSDSIDMSSREILKTSHGRTSFELELGKTLLELDEVVFTSVYLNPSAEGGSPFGVSVELITRPGTAMDRKTMGTVRQLLAASIEEIQPEDVSVASSNFDALFEGGNRSSASSDDLMSVQVQLERRLEEKAQSLLDQIGRQGAIVRVQVIPNPEKIPGKIRQKNGLPTVVSSTDVIGRLDIALVIDRSKVVIAQDTGVFKEEERSGEEIDRLAQLVKLSAGYDSTRGDEMQIRVLQFGNKPLYGKERISRPVDTIGVPGFDQVFQTAGELERGLEAKVQTLMDQVIGRDRSRVRVHALLDLVLKDLQRLEIAGGNIKELAKSENLIPVVRKLSIAMVIDATRVAVDSLSETYTEERRPQEEIDILAQMAREAVGFDTDRDDRMAVLALSFDMAQKLKKVEEAVAGERKEFWIAIAINIAKILGIIAALIVLRFIHWTIRRQFGGETTEERERFEDDPGVLLEEYIRELETAREMQMDLMPRESPRIQGVDIAGSCRPATHVGGDLFQYLKIDDERWWICVADATGHGMGAAIPVVMFSGVLKSQIQADAVMGELLEQLNRSMHGNMTGDTLTGRTFVCFSGGEIDLSAKTFSLSNAGCPFPFHYRAASDDVVELEVEGYPLGVRPYHSFEILEIPLEPQDRIVFCTDGIIEADDQYGNMFGFDRTAYLIQEGCRKGLSAQGLLDYLLEQVHIFAEGKEQEDDQTVVVIAID